MRDLCAYITCSCPACISMEMRKITRPKTGTIHCKKVSSSISKHHTPEVGFLPCLWVVAERLLTKHWNVRTKQNVLLLVVWTQVLENYANSQFILLVGIHVNKRPVNNNNICMSTMGLLLALPTCIWFQDMKTKTIYTSVNWNDFFIIKRNTQSSEIATIHGKHTKNVHIPMA